MKDRTLISLDCLMMVQHSAILLMLGPMLPEIMNAFQISEGTAGLILSAGSLGSTIGPLIAGFGIDRKGIKTAIVLGLFCEALFLILLGLAPFFWLAAAFNFLLVLSSGFIETTVNVIPALLKRKDTVSIMNLVHFFFSLGAFITPLAIGLFISSGGSWQNIIIIFSLPTAILGIIFVLIKFKGAAGENPAAKSDEKSKTGIRSLLSNKTVLFGTITLLLYVGGELGFSAWIVSYLEKQLLYTKMQASLGMSMFWIGIMTGRLSLSFLSRRFSSKHLIITSVIMSTICAVPFLIVRSIPLLYALLFLIGLSMAGGYPVTMAEVNSRFPGRAGTVSGILTFGAGLGAMVFLWLMGFTAEHAGMSAAMVIPFVLMVLMAVSFGIAVKGQSD